MTEKITTISDDLRKVLQYFANKIEDLDEHMSIAHGCTCSNRSEHREINEIIEKKI